MKIILQNPAKFLGPIPRSVLIAMMLIFGTSCNKKADIDIPAERHRLENGITVITVEDHSVPVISYQSWFMVGSVDESPGITGISHLFEHMMFKGTKKYGPKVFDRLLEQNGGSSNAFTTRDITAYQVEINSENLELVVDLESDRLQNLEITEKNLETERKVVMDERSFRIDNNPGGKMHEAIWKQAMPEGHPYAWPVAGEREDLKKISLQDCKDYFKRFYSPSNLTLVLVGDFETSHALKLIKKYYGKIPERRIRRHETPPVHEIASAKRKKIKGETKASRISLVFTSPKAGTRGSLVADLVSNILSTGESSRLQKNLVLNKQLAVSVSAGPSSWKGGGIFTISAQAVPGVPIEKLESGIWESLEELKNKDMEPLELKRAKNQLFSSTIYGLKSFDGVAGLIGWNEVLIGSYKKIFTDLEEYMAIRPSEVRKFSQRFKKENVAVVEMLP